MSSNSTQPACLITKDYEYNVSSLSFSVVLVSKGNAVVNALASPITVSMNVLIIWSVLGSRQLRSVRYNTLLAALALTDLIVGVVVQPLFCLNLICWLKDCKISCRRDIIGTLFILCNCLTLCTMMMACFERYLAIEHPIFHRTKVTNTRVIIATAIVWVIMPASLLTGRYFADTSETLQNVSAVVVSSVIAAVILYCTTKVHITAFLHRRRRRATKAQAQNQNAAVPANEQEEEKREKQEYREAVTMGIIIAASIVFFIPLIMYFVVFASDASNDLKHFIFPSIAFTIVNLQSIVNPVIMSLRVKPIRKEIAKKLFCLSQRTNTPTHQQTNQPTNQSTDKPNIKPTQQDQPNNNPTNKPSNYQQSDQQAIKPPTIRPTNHQTINNPTNKPSNYQQSDQQAIKPPTIRPTNHQTINNPTNKPSNYQQSDQQAIKPPTIRPTNHQTTNNSTN
ncbi:5-hydroxytryptamine receptor 2C [Exaiptasia diaphana]|uniref:G-protein coupled receptors family 1 profile domain-containing protein n=1 Tax=Exaiptasia diaphana TaxID=2652724 RepID=A0A913YGS6_EXADI|nr:5-hydroxytryptamine receptor 2C [Exaiptasia diaphana]